MRFNKINELIRTGKDFSTLKVDDIMSNRENIELDFDEKFLYELLNSFEYIGHRYSKSDLSYIFIGIVVGEVYFMNSESGRGSVTATMKVYKVLKQKYPLRAKVMKKWSSCFGFKSYYWYR